MKTLELLPLNEFKLLKVIQVVGPEWNLFKGYLPYIRSYDPNNFEGDLLDEKILESLQQTLPQTKIVNTYKILFKGQLEEIKNTLKGACTKEICIELFPFIPFEIASQFEGKTFTGYSLNLSIMLHWARNSDAQNNIQDVYICTIDHDKIDNFIKTIRPA
jgi:hypothetical protein